MSWVTYAAIYFIIWWVALFAVLPVGLRTQEEEHAVAPGTVESAPSGSHMPRALLLATFVSAIVFLAIYGAVEYFDLGLDSIPRIIPD